MNSFNIISRINENIHTVNISLNKLNTRIKKNKTNIKIVVIIFFILKKLKCLIYVKIYINLKLLINMMKGLSFEII